MRRPRHDLRTIAHRIDDATEEPATRPAKGREAASEMLFCLSSQQIIVIALRTDHEARLFAPILDCPNSPLTLAPVSVSALRFHVWNWATTPVEAALVRGTFVEHREPAVDALTLTFDHHAASSGCRKLPPNYIPVHPQTTSL